MVKNCPQPDIFAEWPAIFDFIETNPENVMSMCDIVVESVQMLAQNFDDDLVANETKLKNLVGLLQGFLRRNETQHEVVGRLLFAYKYIDNAIWEMEKPENLVICPEFS